MMSMLFAARDKMVWCMVGTAVYQLGLASSIQAKNFSALKPGVQNTCEPAASGANTPAIRPWMWNSGITFSARSDGVSARCSAMCRADATRLAWVSGTIFGRAVVPEDMDDERARRLLDRYADGDTTVADIALRMACDALHVDVEALKASRASAPAAARRSDEVPA